MFQEQNGQPGLQIYLPNEDVKVTSGIQLVQGDIDLESGTWISAPIIPNTVLVNVGLTLEGMTDGLCKANIHRVVFPPAAAGQLPVNRKSIAYFSTPSHDVIMNPVKPGGIVMKTQGECTAVCVVSDMQMLKLDYRRVHGRRVLPRKTEAGTSSLRLFACSVRSTIPMDIVT